MTALSDVLGMTDNIKGRVIPLQVMLLRYYDTKSLANNSYQTFVIDR